MDSLQMRLDALDRLVTQDCRAILGLERQALRGDPDQTVITPNKESKMIDSTKVNNYYNWYDASNMG
jgi:hypothetical protein